mmetsp:Transcript_19438/g.29990  ORF Transcript_19438/g.29990 Transcript_19438/m.29990 type:complete len:154 (-) Transcript_19438:57-518(-)
MIPRYSSQLRRRPCSWRKLPPQFSLRQQRRLMSTSSNHEKKTPQIVRPYSDSLPRPGYEWCSRCGIRTHNFQKRVGEHHPCLDLPRPIWFLQSGMCENARQYYRNQMNVFLVLSVTLFGVIPAVDILVGRTTGTTPVPHKYTGADSVTMERHQ